MRKKSFVKKVLTYSTNMVCLLVNTIVWHQWITVEHSYHCEWPSCPWSNGSWIYTYLCNQCLSPLMLWVRISIRVRCTTLCDKVCQWLPTCRWFSPGTPVSSTNKTDCHDIAEILLKVPLNNIKQTNSCHLCSHRTPTFTILSIYFYAIFRVLFGHNPTALHWIHWQNS